ncbi:MAG: hypothetical protein QM777_14805 [Pseudorhodoferax sp.]
MPTHEPRDRERAGPRPDAADDVARAGVHAERGVPEAEHSQYGLVREDSQAAEGLSEPQIRGTAPHDRP